MDAFPYSLVDYGVTAIALLVMGFIVWQFTKFLSNHMSKVTESLDSLVQTTRGMRDEFFRLSAEERDATIHLAHTADAQQRTIEAIDRLRAETRNTNFELQRHQSTYHHSRVEVEE